MTPSLDIRALHKRFGGIVVTDGVSLTLEPGARHALIGPNGAGKSTLVGLLSGVLTPDAGTILLGGEDITRRTPQERVKRGLVRTFQVNSLFLDLTVHENILLAVSEHRQASRQMFRSLASRTDLIDEARRLAATAGLGEVIDQKVGSLPYGQQRLVEIALALSLEPRLLLLDEPAAGIPSADVPYLLEAIDNLPASIAILLIEHDMALVRRFAKEVTVLVAGQVLCTGKPDLIMSDAEVRRVYLGEGGQNRYASAVAASDSHV